MFTYKQVEALFADLYRAPPEGMGALRGRLKNLKRLGVPMGSHTGKGTRVDYTVEQVWEWAFCLELMECGLDPATIVRIVKEWHAQIRGEFRRAAKDDRELFLVLYPLRLMSTSWWSVNHPRLAQVRQALIDADLTPVAVWAISALTLDKVSATISKFVARGTNVRWLAFNLTRVVRAVEAASKEATT
jgi:hypothetical protein